MSAGMTEMEMNGIFDRDHRTIKNRRESDKPLHISIDSYQFCRGCKIERQNPGQFPLSRFPVLFFRLSNFGMDSVTGRPLKTHTKLCKTNRKIVNYNNLIKRLVQVFIFGVLLTIVRAPTVMSAPTSCRERDGADDSIPKWMNPCGQELYNDNYSSGSVSSSESDRDIIEPILTAARIAQDYMHNFKENYAEETFQFTKTHVLHWLPNRDTEVPKSLGEKVDLAHLESQSLDTFLQSIYESMQKYAVGIEQVVWDQQRTNGKFRKQFVQTESNLIKVLCEIRSAMSNKNIKPSRKVERCIMDDQARKMDDTAERNLRDWIIFKEFYNGLEYLIQVLEYLEANSSSS